MQTTRFIVERVVSAFLASLALVAGTREAQALKVYPLKGLFLQRGATAEAQSGDALISPLFLETVSLRDADLLPSKMRSRLKGLPTTFENKDRRTTLVASLMVARASVYKVNKPNGVIDVYCAVTGALHLTNVMTGEVSFSKARTTIQLNTVTNVDNDDIKASFRTALSDVVHDLVSDVEQEFKTNQITATVRHVSTEYVVLDRGFETGFATGDSVSDEQGNTIELVACQKGACVGRPILGVPAVDGQYSKLAPATVTRLERPGLMVLVQSGPRSFPTIAAQQLFADSLGSKAPVSIVPVNPVFQQVLDEVSAQTNATQDGLRKRKLPKWFVVLNIGTPITYERSTNLDWKRLRVTQVNAVAHIIDRLGRVVATATHTEQIEDELIEGKEVALVDRHEIAIKNALLGLADKVASQIKPDTVTLAIHNDAEIADHSGALVNGSGVTVFRPVEMGDGLPDSVLVPVSNGIAELAQGKATFVGGLAMWSTLPPIASGDVIVVERMHGRSSGKLRILVSTEVKDKGTVRLPDPVHQLTGLLATSARLPIYTDALPQLVGDLLSSANSFERDSLITLPKTDLTARYAVRLNLDGKKCDEGICQLQMKNALGLTVTDMAGTVLQQVALEAGMAGTGYPEATRDLDVSTLATMDGWKALQELAPKVVEKVSAGLRSK